MSIDTISIPDIPDLSGISEEPAASEPYVDCWYKGVILERRLFTDENGNDSVFESGDTPAANGDSRNIRLQIQITRADGRSLNLSQMVNYRPSDLTAETIAAVKAQQEKV